MNSLVTANINAMLDKSEIRRTTVKISKHEADTIAFLEVNKEHLLSLVAQYKPTDKYDYLYNIVLNRYGFSLHESDKVFAILKTFGIYRPKVYTRNLSIAILAFTVVSNTALAFTIPSVYSFAILNVINIVAAAVIIAKS